MTQLSARFAIFGVLCLAPFSVVAGEPSANEAPNATARSVLAYTPPAGTPEAHDIDIKVNGKPVFIVFRDKQSAGRKMFRTAERSPARNTDWFRDAKYGVFMHFLPGDAKSLALVDEFDAESLAQQVQSLGAKYFVITLGQNSGYFNSPNGAYDKITGYAPGERCSVRDLPLALHKALAPKGIRLMLYLPCQTPNEDARAQKAFGLPEGAKDQPLDIPFAKRWAEVIREWSDRYGDKVAGWWFDGGYEHVRFNETIARTYADAAKHGHPHAIVTFNPGVKLIHYTAAEDYTAGELNEAFGVVPKSRRLNGSQWHALTYLGHSWAERDTRYPAASWAAWVKSVIAREGVVTLGMGPNYDAKFGPIGALSEPQVKQVMAIKAALEPP
jgi:hypothetical protein